MTILEYVKDRTGAILIHAAGMIVLGIYLGAANLDTSMIALIIIGWAFVMIVYFLCGYLERKRYFGQLEDLLASLDKPYLISEVMTPPYRQEDRRYREILRRSNKSVIEAIHKLEDEQKNYKEYIESWIHEVKLPITAIELICENQTKPDEKALARKIRPQLTRVENLVEATLFYARSESVYKDYLIKEIDLEEVVMDAVGRNKAFLIQNRMSVDVKCKCSRVYSDGKWLQFILNQLLFNAVKYKKGDDGHVTITGNDIKNGVQLIIEDQGIGIKESEISRVFEKGFTGSNGRTRGDSTGIGLYLCSKLCGKLGIKISVDSQEGSYTKAILTIPRGNYFCN